MTCYGIRIPDFVWVLKWFSDKSRKMIWPIIWRAGGLDRRASGIAVTEARHPPVDVEPRVGFYDKGRKMIWPIIWRAGGLDRRGRGLWLMFFFAFSGAVLSGTNEAWNVILEDGFEKDQPGMLPLRDWVFQIQTGYWDCQAETPALLQVTDQDAHSGKNSLKFAAGNSLRWIRSIVLNGKGSRCLRITWREKMEDIAQEDLQFIVATGDGKEVFSIMRSKENAQQPALFKYRKDGGEWEPISVSPKPGWQQVRVIADAGSESFEIYYDDMEKPVAAGLPFQIKIGRDGWNDFKVSWQVKTSPEILLDDISVEVKYSVSDN